ncbi:MAG: hypothetical protein KGL39_07785 [Patescibacteria group bacterium]|nr:hypothetical protein [Patescibacteria group bacterium]
MEMRNYGIISTKIFTDPESRAWDDETFRLVVYLLAGPHTNAIGCFRLPKGYIATDLGKGFDTLSRPFQNLSQTRFLTYCEGTEYVFIHNFLKYNTFDNANVAKGAVKLAQMVPMECCFFELFCSIIRQLGKWDWPGNNHLIELLPKPFRNGLDTVSERRPNSIEVPEPEPEPEPEPILASLETRARPFDEFWQAYPHKVGKAAAERSFRSAIKKIPLGQMLGALERYRATKPPDRAWCNPATWLNQERWLDEPAHVNGGHDGPATTLFKAGQLAVEIRAEQRRREETQRATDFGTGDGAAGPFLDAE